MKNIFGFIILFSLFLSGCSFGWDETAVTVSAEKSPFYLDIYTPGSDTLKTEIEKTGRITARSSLTLGAKGVGEIAQLAVKEGTSVKAGTIIARLKDTLTNYDLQLAQAENALTIQNASRDTTSINLDNALENSRIAYERAEQAYKTLTGRNGLQYELTVSANKKTLDAYNENFKSYITELEKSMTQYLYEWDKILGITTVFQYTNDGWEPYLGARIGNIKVQADNDWNNVYAFRWELRARIEKGTEINREDPEGDIMLIATGYEALRAYVDTMLYMLQNNVIGGWLPQVQQDGWMLSWNGYRSQVGGAESGYNAWRWQTVSFFKNYQKTELATQLALSVLTKPLTPEQVALLASDIDLKTTYESTKIDIEERTRNSELSLEQAKLAYDNAKALKESTLIQLDGSKRGAEISLELARRNADNLVVRAPVGGTITKVLTSVGQSVATGTPVVEFTSNEPEVAIDVESSLARTLTVGEIVQISVDDKQYTGTIIALSEVTGKNLLSSMRISVLDGIDAIGKTAKIVFYPKQDIEWTLLTNIPLEAVRIIAENEWEIRYFKDGKILTKTITISGIRSGLVETSDILDDDIRIITTDTTNYDQLKHTLIVK